MTSAILPAAICLLLFLVPGVILGAASGARGWLLLGAAPAITLGFVGIAAPILSLLGIPWRLLSVVVALVAFSAVAALAIRPWRMPRDQDSGPRWALWQHAAVAGAAVFTTAFGIYITARGSQNLDGLHQFWDAVAHANVIRFIETTGDADSVAAGAIAAPASTHPYYPATVHALAALALDLPGGGMPRVLNAIVAPVPGLLALSTIALVRQVTPRPAIVFFAALVAGMFIGFPYSQVALFPLLSFVPAVAAAPAVIALIDRLLRRPSASVVLTVSLACAGLVTTHLSVALAVAMAAVFQLGLVLVQNSGRLPRARLLLILAAAALTLVFSAQVLGSLLNAAAGAGGVDWPAVTDPGDATRVLLTLSTGTNPAQLILAIPMLLGFLLCWRTPKVIPVALLAGIMGLFFVWSSAYDNSFVQAVTAFWWNDKWRFLALFLMVAPLFIGIGLTAIRDVLVRALTRLWHRIASADPFDGPHRNLRRAVVATLSVALLTGGLLLATDGGYRRQLITRVALPFINGPTVVPAEEQAYAVMAQLYDGGLVMNDPIDGSPWLYALENVPPVFMTPPTPPYDPANFGADRMLLLEHFDELGHNPDVDAAIRRLDVRWVIIGLGFVHPDARRADGIRDLADNPALREVYNNGTATIYRIVG